MEEEYIPSNQQALSTLSPYSSVYHHETEQSMDVPEEDCYLSYSPKEVSVDEIQDSQENSQEMENSENEISDSFPSPEPVFPEEEVMYYELPENADIITVRPLIFHYKGLKFTETYFQTKIRQNRGRFTVLISPFEGALKKSTIRDLMQECVPFKEEERTTKHQKFFRASRIFSVSGSEATGWVSDLDKKELVYNKPSGFLEEFAKHPTPPPKQFPSMAWSLTEDEGLTPVLKSLSAPKLTKDYESWGPTLKNAWGPLRESLFQEEFRTRTEAKVMLTIHESFNMLINYAKGSSRAAANVSTEHFRNRFSKMADFMETLLPSLQHFTHQKMYGVVQSGETMRNFATADMAPQNMMMTLRGAPFFTEPGHLFPRDSVMKAEKMAMEAFHTTFNPARASIMIKRSLPQQSSDQLPAKRQKTFSNNPQQFQDPSPSNKLTGKSNKHEHFVNHQKIQPKRFFPRHEQQTGHREQKTSPRYQQRPNQSGQTRIRGSFRGNMSSHRPQRAYPSTQGRGYNRRQ